MYILQKLKNSMIVNQYQIYKNIYHSRGINIIDVEL